MFLASSRFLFLLPLTVSVLAMGGVLYLEYGVGLVPCSLCVLQQFFLAGFCVISLIAVVHGPGKIRWRIYSLLGLLFSLAGAATAARQVLLQRVPEELVSVCQPGLSCMLEGTSLFHALQTAFRGTEDCAEINWTLFDLSIPEWSLLAFVGMSAFAVYQVLRSVSAS